jgi:hypothetical protein
MFEVVSTGVRSFRSGEPSCKGLRSGREGRLIGALGPSSEKLFTASLSGKGFRRLPVVLLKWAIRSGSADTIAGLPLHS